VPSHKTKAETTGLFFSVSIILFPAFTSTHIGIGGGHRPGLTSDYSTMNIEFKWFSVESLQNELEHHSGIKYIRNPFQIKDLHKDFRRLFLQISKEIGSPVSQNTQGDLLLDIQDRGFAPNDLRARGPYSNRKLSFHTDRCDVIGFLCLQPAKSGGENQIIKSQEIEKIILKERKDLHQILCSPFPLKRHNMDSLNPSPYCLQPIFSWKNQFFACSYLRVLIDRANQDPECPSLTEHQEEALDFLDSVCERAELQTKISLNKGDMLFLNNWTTLHRRTEFIDYNEPQKKRHLLRVWLSMPNSRPLNSMFKENFGAVESGAIRGGIQANPPA